MAFNSTDKENIIDLFIQSHPALKNLDRTKKEELNKILMNVLSKVFDGKPESKADMTKEFIQKLTVIFNMTAKAAIAPKNSPQNLLDNLKKVLQENGLLDKDGKLDKDKLLKLTPEQLTKLEQDLKNPLKLFLTAITAMLAPTLKPGKNNVDDIVKRTAKLLASKGNEQDPYVNLLGVINSRITGGIPVIIQCFIGNGLNIADVNPEHGLSQIDQANRAAVGIAPDAGSELVQAFDSFLSELNQNKHLLAPSNTPTLTRDQ